MKGGQEQNRYIRA